MKYIKKAILLITFIPLFTDAFNLFDIAHNTLNDTITIIRHEVADLCNFTAQYAFANWAFNRYFFKYNGSFKRIYNQATWSTEKEMFLQYLAFIAALKTTAYLIRPHAKVYTYQISHK